MRDATQAVFGELKPFSLTGSLNHGYVRAGADPERGALSDGSLKQEVWGRSPLCFIFTIPKSYIYKPNARFRVYLSEFS